MSAGDERGCPTFDEGDELLPNALGLRLHGEDDGLESVDCVHLEIHLQARPHPPYLVSLELVLQQRQRVYLFHSSAL